jgi:hypothetical protein
LIPPEKQPPHEVVYSLDEALELLAALEDARDVLAETNHLAVLAAMKSAKPPGMSGPAVYRHYGSKAHLLVAAVERGLDRFVEGYREVWARQWLLRKKSRRLLGRI